MCWPTILRCGGGNGIRTHETVRFTRFPSVRDRPLCHPSYTFDSLRFGGFNHYLNLIILNTSH